MRLKDAVLKLGFTAIYRSECVKTALSCGQTDMCLWKNRAPALRLTRFLRSGKNGVWARLIRMNLRTGLMNRILKFCEQTWFMPVLCELIMLWD